MDDVWYTGRGFDLFSGNDVASSVGASIGYAVWTDGPVSLVPELGASVDSQGSDGLFGGTLSRTNLDVTNLYGGGSLRYALLPVLEPEVRLAVGASRLKASVDTSTGETLSTDALWAAFGSLGAGLTLRTRPGALETQSGSLRSLAFGITAEGGYLLGQSVDLTPVPEHTSGRVHTENMSLGSLGRSGPYVRVAAGVRF